jgi:hypothetical protein
MIYRYKKNKLWKNRYVSVRDYIVRKCYENKDDLIIYFKNKKMIIKNDDLLKFKNTTKDIFCSKQNTSKHRKYRLFDYVFKPIKENKLFDL